MTTKSSAGRATSPRLRGILEGRATSPRRGILEGRRGASHAATGRAGPAAAARRRTAAQGQQLQRQRHSQLQAGAGQQAQEQRSSGLALCEVLLRRGSWRGSSGRRGVGTVPCQAALCSGPVARTVGDGERGDVGRAAERRSTWRRRRPQTGGALGRVSARGERHHPRARAVVHGVDRSGVCRVQTAEEDAPQLWYL